MARLRAFGRATVVRRTRQTGSGEGRQPPAMAEKGFANRARLLPSAGLLIVALICVDATYAANPEDALGRASPNVVVGELVFRQKSDAHRWLATMDARLAPRIESRAKRLEFLITAQAEAIRAGLDPQLVLALIDVLSGFRQYAVSSAGARGYMQVMPFWVKLIGRRGDNLFQLRTNLRYGCVILRHYLDMEKGDYFRALGRYNGSLGKPDFPRAVLAVWKVTWGYDGPTS